MSRRLTRAAKKRVEQFRRDSKPFFDDIPDELLVSIFGFLPLVHRAKAELVCRRFRRVAIELWKKQTVLKIAGVSTTPSWSMQVYRQCDKQEHRYFSTDI